MYFLVKMHLAQYDKHSRISVSKILRLANWNLMANIEWHEFLRRHAIHFSSYIGSSNKSSSKDMHCSAELSSFMLMPEEQLSCVKIRVQLRIHKNYTWIWYAQDISALYKELRRRKPFNSSNVSFYISIENTFSCSNALYHFGELRGNHYLLENSHPLVKSNFEALKWMSLILEFGVWNRSELSNSRFYFMAFSRNHRKTHLFFVEGVNCRGHVLLGGSHGKGGGSS